MDQERRAKLFVQMNELLIQDAAVIPLVNYANPIAMNVDIKGYDFPTWDVEVWDIANWYK
jgi:peptide/nickel transport system substrate-binding protein